MPGGNSRTVRSTSRSSAVTDEIVLRETSTTRLVFRPVLVENPYDSEASIRGSFVFQRKGSLTSWEDIVVPPLTKMKHGEAIKLDIKSGELLKLFCELSMLYDMYKIQGIPRGEVRFVKATETIRALAKMSEEELNVVISGERDIGGKALSRLIQWAGKTENFPYFVEQLEAFGHETPGQLKAALGVATLKRALKEWSDNRKNNSEEFWQQTLVRKSFVLEQIFHVPIVIIKSKAYVGGKSVKNTEGKVVDFLVKNQVTSSVALIEIKTPMTSLLGTEYRESGIYNASKELNGAIMQILAYKDSLEAERDRLLSTDVALGECFDPQCIVIIGSARQELQNQSKRRSFELYRRQFSDVTIMTYDELYGRTRRLVEILEGGLEPTEKE